MIPRFSFSLSKHIEHVVMFSFLLIIVPIQLSVHKVLLLLIGRVYTIVKLIRVINFVRITGIVTVPRVVSV